MDIRRAVRAEIEASPGIEHLALRRKFQVGEGIVESALTKDVAGWDVLIGATPLDQPGSPAKARNDPRESRKPDAEHASEAIAPIPGISMPGLEQGIVKFTRKPAKMGMDFIFWVPRVYIKNGIVDPSCVYEVFLKKIPKE
jgi:hypothetical protein